MCDGDDGPGRRGRGNVVLRLGWKCTQSGKLVNGEKRRRAEAVCLWVDLLDLHTKKEATAANIPLC